MTWRDGFERLWEHLAHPRRWKLHLALGAGTILAAGVLLAPQAPAPVVHPPEQKIAPLLREGMERRDAGAAFREVSQLAGKVGGAVVLFLAGPANEPVVHPDFAVRLAPPRRPLGYGLLVSAQGDILSHVSAIDRQLNVDVRMPVGALTRATVRAFERDTGLVLLRLSAPSEAAPAELNGAPAAPGDIVAAVTVGPDAAPVAQPAFVTSDAPASLGLAAFSEGLTPGTPLFRLDGSAIGIVGATPNEAWTAARSLDRLSDLAATGHGIPATIGVRLQAVSEALRPFVGDVAAVVVEVDPGGPAARAGVRVGDGLSAVNGTTVSDLPGAVDAIAGLPLDEPREVALVRGGQPVSVQVQAAATLAARDARPSNAPGPSGPSVGQLFSPEATAEAGMVPEAVVLAIDGRAMSERAAASYLRRTRGPRLLYLFHDGQHYFAAAEARR